MRTKLSAKRQKTTVVKKQKREPIKEARRYVDNAYEILAERGKLDEEGFQYEDEKYVRAAGNYLWLGVLMGKGLCDSGFEYANKIINRCETMMPAC